MQTCCCDRPDRSEVVELIAKLDTYQRSLYPPAYASPGPCFTEETELVAGVQRPPFLGDLSYDSIGDVLTKTVYSDRFVLPLATQAGQSTVLTYTGTTSYA